MAKAAEAEEKAKVPKVYDGIDENGLAWKDVSYLGTTYRIRQITVEEADTAWDAALDTKTDKLNWRFNNRLSLSTAIVSPATTIDQIEKWSNAKLGAMLRAFDVLNSLEDADTEGN